MKRLLMLCCVSVLITIAGKAFAWYCFESYENISACFETKIECSYSCLQWVKRFDISAIECSKDACAYQPGAVCFGFYDVVNKLSSESCADSFRSCEFFRRLILAEPKEYHGVTKCEVK